MSRSPLAAAGLRISLLRLADLAEAKTPFVVHWRSIGHDAMFMLGAEQPADDPTLRYFEGMAFNGRAGPFVRIERAESAIDYFVTRRNCRLLRSEPSLITGTRFQITCPAASED